METELTIEQKRYIALGKAFELFLSSERIRILGTAGIGDHGYQHIGMEIWSKYPEFSNLLTKDNRGIIYKYIMGMKGIENIKDNPTMNDLISEFILKGETK